MARPRVVPEPEALERAMLLFWKNGYDRTSIADLGEAIGVGPSSIYNAFGSKAALYRRALDRYMETRAGFAAEFLDGEGDLDLEASIREFLRKAIKLYTTKGLPQGCAMLQSGGAGAPDDSGACAVTFEMKQGLESALRKRLESRTDAKNALAAPPRTLAMFLVATLRGLSQLACDGASQKELLLVADHVAGSCVSTRGS